MQGYRKIRRPSRWPLTATGTATLIAVLSGVAIALLLWGR